MKVKLLSFVGVCSVLMAACSAEEQDALGTGQLTPALTADYSVPLSTDPAVLTTTSSQPQAEDFAITILREDGSTYNSWEKFSDFPEGMKFPLGSFVFKASYGSLDKEGFDMPYFEGSTPFQVFDKQNTDISVTCTLANAKVSLTYSDAFKNYFSDFATTLKTENKNSIIFSKTEEREAYVKPGKMVMQMSLVKPDGSSMIFSPEIFIAEAHTHYRVNFDVNDGAIGEATLFITFDETTELNPITINLADGSISAKPPFSSVMGFESGVQKVIKELDTSVGDVNALITAPTGLGSCVMTTTSAYLQSKGWPQEADLNNLTPEQQQLFASMGLRLKGFVNKDKMAYVDFTNLIPKLEYVEGSAEHTFTLKATDTQGRPAEDVVLAVTSQARPFSLETPAPVQIGSTQAVVPVKVDGNPSLVSIYYIDDNGQSQNCTVKTIEPAENQLYNFTIELNVENRPRQLRATYFNVKNSEEKTVEVTTPPYSLSIASAGDVWAKKTMITVAAENPEDQVVVMKYLTLYSGDTKVDFSRQGDNKILVSGLTDNATYQWKATCTDYEGNTNFSNMVSATTEKADIIPNGDFENLTQTINSTINQGGTWTQTNLGSAKAYQTTLSMTVSEPVGWASVNAKTCNTNASNKNTWYVIPSTFNTSLTWLSHQPDAKIIGIGQSPYDSTADIYKNLSAQNGSNAVVVRNVAWDANGADVGRDQKTGNTSYSNYYCSKIPSVSSRSAGKLFLGSYSYSNGQETYNEGVGFASRPIKLEGYYKYANDPQDTAEKGLVTVQILNGATVIGSASAELGAANAYTQFSAPINYTHPDLKATHLRIMISSSNRTNEADIKTTNYVSKEECCSRGAALTVDNLTFSYVE